MTLQQIEYMLAVYRYKHFAKAAEFCHVTQPTLSAMIQKLEEELGIRIFDRKQQPVGPTPIGKQILAQGREVLLSVRKLNYSDRRASCRERV